MLGLGQRSIHKAITYLDTFYATKAPEHHESAETSKVKLKSRAFAAVMLSSKITEVHDSDLFYSASFSRAARYMKTSLEGAAACEVEMLQALDCNLTVADSYEFVECILHHNLHCSDADCVEEKAFQDVSVSPDGSTLKDSVAAYCVYYNDISATDTAFLDFTPSVRACAAIAAARMEKRVSPVWPEGLEKVSGLSLEGTVAKCASILRAVAVRHQDEESGRKSSSSDQAK